MSFVQGPLVEKADFFLFALIKKSGCISLPDQLVIVFQLLLFGTTRWVEENGVLLSPVAQLFGHHHLLPLIRKLVVGD